MRSVFSFSAVCNADCWSICWARWWPAWTTMAQLHFLRINPHTTHNSSNRSDEGLILNNVLFFSRENLNIYIRARGLKPNRQINCWPWICCNTKRGGRSKNFLLWHYIKIANEIYSLFWFWETLTFSLKRYKTSIAKIWETENVRLICYFSLPTLPKLVHQGLNYGRNILKKRSL